MKNLVLLALLGYFATSEMGVNAIKMNVRSYEDPKEEAKEPAKEEAKPEAKPEEKKEEKTEEKKAGKEHEEESKAEHGIEEAEAAVALEHAKDAGKTPA